jgi:hypothetical protein
MAKTVEIPQDIIDNVIAAVGDDKRLLKQCSLVSSSFLLPSRKQLFSRITLRSDETCRGIHQFLIQNPLIQSYVRAISLNMITIRIRRAWPVHYKISEWMNGASLLAILRLPFCRLESFSIRDDWDWNWNWNHFSSELKDVLSNIIHTSTLKTLSLKGITKVPIVFFLHIVHLRTLELDSLSPNRFGGESSLAQAASMGVAPSRAVIDRFVWHFGEGDVRGTRFPSSAYFSLIRDREGSTRWKVLPFLCRLRFFEIHANLGYATRHAFEILSFIVGSLYVSLTSPATLEHLEFNICFRGDRNDFEPSIFYNDLRNANVWRHLDSMTTDPTGSRLQRVDINIDYTFCSDVGNEPDEDEVLKAVIDGLPLLHRKGILTVEAVMAKPF